MTFSSLVHLSWGEYLETLIEAVLGACHRGRNRVGTVPGGATWSNEERGIELPQDCWWPCKCHPSEAPGDGE